jgi:hypothetical protein
MNKQYDSSTYKEGKYSLAELANFNSSKKIPANDIEYRVAEVSRELQTKMNLIVESMFRIIQDDTSKIPNIAKEALERVKTGKNPFPREYEDWNKELEFYYKNNLLSPKYVTERYTKQKTNPAENELISKYYPDIIPDKNSRIEKVKKQVLLDLLDELIDNESDDDEDEYL